MSPTTRLAFMISAFIALAGSQPANSASKLPTPSLLPVSSKTDAIDKYLRDRPLSMIEGIWLEDNNNNELAIVKAPAEFADYCDFVAVITETKRSNWKIGEVKVLISESATEGLYSVSYLSTSFKSVTKAWATVQQGFFSIRLDAVNEVRFVKVYPKLSSGARADRADGAGGGQGASGSGFMLSPTIAVTSHHVISSASRIRVVIGPLTIPASILLQDERNDLAVLQLQPPDSVVANMLRANTSCLSVREDSPATGERVFAMGYPLSGVLNSDVVITEGLISSSVGPNGDANTLQTTAPIQPGSSGGPLLDEKGRVVGVIAGTANPSAIFSATGSLPQNVNFAVSAIPVRTMVKFIPGNRCDAFSQIKELNAQGIKSLCSRAIVKIEALR